MSVKALKTRDKLLAAKQITVLTRIDDDLWYRLRNGITPEGSLEEAQALLARFDLEAKPISQQRENEINIDHFFDTLSAKAPNDEHPIDVLADHELRALAILNDRDQFTLTDAKRLYLKKRNGIDKTAKNRKLRNVTNAAFAPVLELLGDREITKYKRVDISTVIEAGLAKGLKTATLKRQLGIVRAAINDLIREYELHSMHNPFKEFDIPNLLEDANDRASLDIQQIASLREFISSTEGSTADIIGMLLDTGSRLSDLLGLKITDVQLDADIPHIIFHKNSFRRLKTKASVRKVPLVGAALFCAKRAVASATTLFVFDRYVVVAEERIRNEGASATVNKALGRLGCLTCHCMRHTMRTRLRNADVPAVRAEELQGWSRVSIADQYGEQTALRNLQADLLNTL
ncbi:MAG: tyrosine-type recombinase/integrase [Pseudomonadales bacterium]|nr:tyrosine-type recombinase/integrase [Pseudomonadales bacterium]NRA17467.1 tyrosine-type recombinase/integrase [Oceanospirillaceae bacterium]